MEQISTKLDTRTGPALMSLALGVFAVGTEGLVFAGLLPTLAADLDVSVAAAGQVTTVFAIAYTLAAPLLSVVTDTWPRRAALLTGFTLLTAGNALSALAPSLGLLLCWRIITAAGASLITPTSLMVAATLVEPFRRARAIAVVMTGMTLASAAGAPLGTLIGGALGWRAAIWTITALGLSAAIAVGFGITRLPGRARQNLTTRLAPLRIPTIRRVLATTLIGFVAVYSFYTYVSVIYSPLTGNARFLALVLLVIGVAGIAGNFLAGNLTDRHGARPVVTLALLITAIGTIAAGFAGTHVAALITAAIYGGAAWSITGPQQHRLLAADTGQTGLPVALNSSALYLAIAIAGALGGTLGATGHWTLVGATASIALIAAAVSYLADRPTTRADT
ncbi:MAG: MFS transporter [Gordonia sp. (in: high G+C Gram-positive bacteria)]